MDVFGFLSYINKVSLFAFFVTTLVVAYQVYNLKKERSKEQTPVIPDFKENSDFGIAANFTSLPSSLTKKELKAVNYSKLVFLVISLLTIIIVVFVVSLIKKNSPVPNQALNNQTAVTVTPGTTAMGDIDEKNNLTPTPTGTVPTGILPSEIVPTDITPAVDSQLTIEPTEIILAKSPSSTPTTKPGSVTEVVNKPEVLPETGSWEKGFLIIGVAISTILFSFFL